MATSRRRRQQQPRPGPSRRIVAGLGGRIGCWAELMSGGGSGGGGGWDPGRGCLLLVSWCVIFKRHTRSELSIAGGRQLCLWRRERRGGCVLQCVRARARSERRRRERERASECAQTSNDIRGNPSSHRQRHCGEVPCLSSSPASSSSSSSGDGRPWKRRMRRLAV